MEVTREISVAEGVLSGRLADRDYGGAVRACEDLELLRSAGQHSEGHQNALHMFLYLVLGDL